MNNNLIQFGFYNDAFTLRFHVFAHRDQSWSQQTCLKELK